ncbi:antitoxin [Actinokineospora auranticolor]|uniref:Antitoxin protein of toxin-antitoxin system n=1 Tax=Actinokineospora auranticolor TaxID=155976 RepID=A0A2S6GFU0_9PSEU|nr:antitoxin [Actinokineospora auranticolor]PPK64055.1 antitoxin protein of toxin-antitoxin system [Actinokineospora auranticolor]
MPLLKKLTALAGAAAAATKYAKKNPEKVNRMAAKAGHFVDQKTKGKYSRQINNAVRRVNTATSPKPGH